MATLCLDDKILTSIFTAASSAWTLETDSLDGKAQLLI